LGQEENRLERGHGNSENLGIGRIKGIGRKYQERANIFENFPLDSKQFS
jgi:hypothetical protein